MSIRPHTQQHQIETGQLVFAQTKKLSHRTLVLVRGGRCIGVFAVNAEDLVLTQEQVRKQSFASHAIVAVGVIGADMPLIAPEKKDSVPPYFPTEPIAHQ